jgi:septum formation protein
MEFILASASSRRKKLFADLVEDFEVIVSNFKEENVIEDMLPKKLVKVLAAGKAKDVLLQEGNEGKIVVGADTVVTYNNEILGKPRRDSEAVEMLKTLSGNKHIVYTGVCIAFMEKGEVKTLSCVDKTVVYFETLTDEFIKEYVASGSPRDKAGAYGI